MFAPMIDRFTDNMKQQSMQRNGFDPSQFMASGNVEKTLKENQNEPLFIKDPDQASYFLSLKKPDNMNSMFDKIKALPFELSDEEKAYFRDSNTLFMSGDVLNEDDLPTIDIIEKMLLELNTTDGHVPLFLLRLAVAKEQVNVLVATKKDFITFILNRYNTCAPLNSRIMAALFAANMFAHSIGAETLSDPSIADMVITCSVELLNEEQEQPRLAGSALMHNCAIGLY